ncbi:MAG: hypothetical protein IKH90_10105 [Ruminococcus sp.]|nr:hypothetical protein [Ruminococcus sp.]
MDKLLNQGLSKLILCAIFLLSLTFVGCDYESSGGNSREYVTSYRFRNKHTSDFPTHREPRAINQNSTANNEELEIQWNDYLNKQYDKYGV